LNFVRGLGDAQINLIYNFLPFRLIENKLKNHIYIYIERERAREKMEQSMGEKMVGADVAPPFKPKKGGVIPPKRRSVKRMMFDSILQSIATLLCPHRHPSPSDIRIISPPNKSPENAKNMKILPCGGKSK
jgi:hypothetical protein